MNKRQRKKKSKRQKYAHKMKRIRRFERALRSL